jgi:hypothetical protein
MVIARQPRDIARMLVLPQKTAAKDGRVEAAMQP